MIDELGVFLLNKCPPSFSHELINHSMNTISKMVCNNINSLCTTIYERHTTTLAKSFENELRGVFVCFVTSKLMVMRDWRMWSVPAGILLYPGMGVVMRELR